MAYTTAEGRQQLLDDLAAAVEHLAVALAALSEAYERLDEAMADRIEQELFGPVQLAYGRARRTSSAFARRYGLPIREHEPASPGAPSQGVKRFIEAAMAAVGAADLKLASLQDSMLPVEVGDAELRAGLQEVRTLLGELAHRAHELLRTLGR